MNVNAHTLQNEKKNRIDEQTMRIEYLSNQLDSMRITAKYENGFLFFWKNANIFIFF